MTNTTDLVRAWMDPSTLDVIHADRKKAWAEDYGAGGKSKAAAYTVPLYTAQQPEAPAQPEFRVGVDVTRDGAQVVVLRCEGDVGEVIYSALHPLPAAPSGEAVWMNQAAGGEAVDFYVCDLCGHYYQDEPVSVCDCAGDATEFRHVRMAPITPPAAALRSAQAPDGWVLVPREPTDAMLDAMHGRIRILCNPAERTADIQNDAEVWAAMIAAAPSAEGVE